MSEPKSTTTKLTDALPTTTQISNAIPTTTQLQNAIPTTTDLKSSLPTLPTSTEMADSIPIPTLEESAPITTQLRSHMLILVLLAGAIISAYIYGFELLQPADHTSYAEMGVSLCLLVLFGGGTLWFIGVQKVDWWAVVLGYWWLSMPAALGGGLFLVRVMEGSEGIDVKD